MTIPKLDELSVGQMASGHLYLNLTSRVSWEAFPEYAQQFLRVFSGIVREATDTPDMRIWTITIAEQELRLVYEDYPQMVSLESSSDDTDDVIRTLYAQLLDQRVC